MGDLASWLGGRDEAVPASPQVCRNPRALAC